MIVGPVNFKCNNKLFYADYVLSTQGFTNRSPFFYIRFLVHKEVDPVVVLSNFQYSKETSVTNLNEHIALEFYCYMRNDIYENIGRFNKARGQSTDDAEHNLLSSLLGAVNSFLSACYSLVRYIKNKRQREAVTHDNLNEFIWIERYPDGALSIPYTMRVEFTENLKPNWVGKSTLPEIYKWYPRELIEIDFDELGIMLPFNNLSPREIC